MSRAPSRKNQTGQEQPRFTTPHMLNSRRSESRQRLNRLTYSRRRRRPEISSGRIVAAILAIIVLFLLIFMVWSLLHKNAQSVRIDNEQVAYIKDVKTTTEEFNNLLLAKLKEKTGNNVQINETVTLVPVHVSPGKIDNNTENVVTTICGMLTYKQEAAAITVNGEQKAILANQAEAESLLDQILAIYQSDDEDVVEIAFVDDVQVESVFVEEEEVMTTVKASDILRAHTKQAQTYTVKSGDTFGSIAANADMTEAELLAANPSFTAETMHMIKIGQELNITVPVPVLSVKIVRELKEEEAIPPETNTVENSSEYTTYRKVISEGKAGKKEVTTHITYVNGYEEGREVVGETIIEDQTPQTVEVGTLNP